MNESLDEFKFWPDTTTNSGVICPCRSEKLIFNCCEHSSAFIFYLINLILAGNEDMHEMKALMSSNFGQIPPPTLELSALEGLKK